MCATAMISVLISFVTRLYLALVRCVFRLPWAAAGPTKMLLPPIEDPALVQSARTLALWIRQRKRSAASIMEAFRRRVEAVNPIINAVVDDRFEAALREAREVDRRLDACTQEEREEIGRVQPLLGVPFTAKETVMVDGLSNTAGLLSRQGVKAPRDSEVVSRLRKAGAIPMAVTNVPELAMWLETYNVLHGRTVNPYDVSRTSGGSSGGEAALLTSCGTPLSVGTDIGGSIRFPASCCGTFGHKPTSGWVPLSDTRPFQRNDDAKICVTGPLGRSVGDLVMFLESVAPEAAGLAAKVANTDVGSIKIWWTDEMQSPWCRPTEPSLSDALRAACKHLHHSFGATTCQFQWPCDMARAFQVWACKRQEDGKGEGSLITDMTNRKGPANLPEEWLRWMCGRGRHTFPILLVASVTRPRKSDQSDHINLKKIQSDFLDKLGQNGVLVVPVFPRVAPYHGEMIWFWKDGGYLIIFNAMEMPSTAVPLGLTKDGLPIGLQVVATPGNDHLCLAVAAALEEKFGGWVSPSPINV